MPSPSSTSSSERFDSERLGRRTLKALLLALAVCAIVDAACRFLLPKASVVVKLSTAQAFLEQAEVPDVQIVGDSVAYRGLLGSALAPDDSFYVRNDSLSNTTIPYSYFLLRRQFEEGRTPQALVVAHSPFAFSQPALGEMAATLLTSRELMEVAVAGYWQDALYALLAKASYILMNRASFRALMMRGDYRFFVTPSSQHVHRTLSDRSQLDRYLGTSAEEAGRGRIWEEPDLPALRRLATFYVAPETDRYLRKLLALAKEYEVPVFWITMPIPRIAGDIVRETGFEQKLEAYLSQFERSGDLTILKGGFSVYEDALFGDTVHADPAGAVRFACELQSLAPLLASKLPARPAKQPAFVSDERRQLLAEQTETRHRIGDLCGSLFLSDR